MFKLGVLSSFTFRFIAWYVAGLSLAVFATMGSIYGYYSYNYFKDVNRGMLAELDGLELAYREHGRRGLSIYVGQRTRLGYLNRFFYLAVDGEFAKITGNLEAWPGHMEFPGWWINFELDMRDWGDKGSEVEFVALSRRFDNGVQVLVARHFEEVFAPSKRSLFMDSRHQLSSIAATPTVVKIRYGKSRSATICAHK